jgi:O-antigen/teichoic acid export membrane protein
MNKFKLFIENFFVYGMGGIISKIIPLIMVPIITRIMPNSSYYGINDLSNTVISFCSSIAVMGMYDAMYRLFFEKDEKEYKKTVCSTAAVFTLGMSIVIFLLMLLFKDMIAQYFFSDKKYAYMIYLSAMATLVGATNSIISAPVRMQNKRKIYLIINTISPLLSYAISISLLLLGYYTIALPFAAVISGVVIEISFWAVNREWFSFKRFDRKLLKPLLTIAIPLLPNFLIYWIFNSCDKVMITNMLGVGAAGIYSVGSKFGHCSQLVYTAFAGGWQFFALSTMKEKNQVKINSIIFEYLGIISFIATTFVCAWSYWIFDILFTEEYLDGYIIAPYLFLAPLLQMLYQVIGNQFLIIKKTWPSSFVLAAGAVVNIIINYLTIPILGIEGAAIATLIGYIISDIVCVVVLIRMKLMIIEFRFIMAALIMAVYFSAWRRFFSDSTIICTLLAVVVSGIFIFLYREDIKNFLTMVKINKHK